MRFFSFIIIILILNIAAIFALYFVADHQVASKGAQILSVEREIDAMDARMGGRLRSRKISNDDMADLLAALSESIPKRVRLSELRSDSQRAVVLGYGLTKEDISAFSSALQKAAGCSQLRIVSVDPDQINRIAVFRFQLECTMGGSS